jgi:cell wall-associated NlpC family hydrolase
MKIRSQILSAILILPLSIGAFATTAAAAPSKRQEQVATGIAAQARAALANLRWLGLIGDTAAKSYALERDAIAADVAVRYGTDVAEMQQAWGAADLAHQSALMAALSEIGVRYRTNAGSPSAGFDCSGLTSWAWRQAGVEIAHQSGSQIHAAAPRSIDEAQAGDIVWYPGHVMIYLGAGGLMVHAPYTGRSVEIDDIPRHSVRFGDPTA